MLKYIAVIFFIFSISIPIWAGKVYGVDIPGVKSGEYNVSTATVAQCIKYIRRKGTTNYTKMVLDTPKVKVIHLKNRSTRGRWEGINLYNYKRRTYIYVIPRKYTKK